MPSAWATSHERARQTGEGVVTPVGWNPRRCARADGSRCYQGVLVTSCNMVGLVPGVWQCASQLQCSRPSSLKTGTPSGLLARRLVPRPVPAGCSVGSWAQCAVGCEELSLVSYL